MIPPKEGERRGEKLVKDDTGMRRRVRRSMVQSRREGGKV